MIFIHLLASLEHILTGYLCAMLFGSVIGVYFYTGANKLFILVFDWLRSVPAIALFPIFIYTVGNGWAAKSLVIFWTSFPVFALGVYAGLTGVDRQIKEAAVLDGCTNTMALFKVCFPAAMPAIIVAARSAFGAALIGVTAAEMLGSSKGLGFYIMASSQTFKFVDMGVGIFTLGLLGVVVNHAFAKIYNRMEM